METKFEDFIFPVDCGLIRQFIREHVICNEQNISISWYIKTALLHLVNPLYTVDGGYSSSLRDATGPVDQYSRIPTSTQVTCLAA